MKKSIRMFLAVCAAGAAVAVLAQSKPPHSGEQILLETAAEREAWLNLRGWQVGTPQESRTRIPQQWKTLPGQRWLAVQNAQGLHPEQYAGCEVSRLVYPVTGTGQSELYAELLFYDNTLIGAQVYSAETGIIQSVR